MFRPALIWRSISQSHIRQTNTLPTRSRRRAPHTGQVLLVHAGLTLMIGTPSRALVLDLTMGLPPRPARKTPVHLPRSAPRAVKREVLEDYCGAILPCDFDQL